MSEQEQQFEKGNLVGHASGPFIVSRIHPSGALQDAIGNMAAPGECTLLAESAREEHKDGTETHCLVDMATGKAIRVNGRPEDIADMRDVILGHPDADDEQCEALVEYTRNPPDPTPEPTYTLSELTAAKYELLARAEAPMPALSDICEYIDANRRSELARSAAADGEGDGQG